MDFCTCLPRPEHAFDANPDTACNGTEAFEADPFDQLDCLVRSKANERHPVHLTAGFCWPWSNQNPDGTIVPDVKVENWQMPWNAQPDAGRLAPNVRPSNLWPSDLNGINQVGCVSHPRHEGLLPLL